MPTLLRNGTLVDGTGHEPIPNGCLLMADDGSISYAGPVGGLPAEASAATVVDVEGHSIMPGFIDAQTHFAFVTGTSNFVFPTVTQDLIVTYAMMMRNLKVTLEAGITSARDIAGLDRGFMLAIDQGLIPGPRLSPSCGGICAPGGHFDFRYPTGLNPLPAITAPGCEFLLVSGADQARAAARELIWRGAKVIKIATSGGVTSPNDSPMDEGLTLDEVQAIVEIARTHMGGVPVAAHAQGPAGISVALEGGVTSIEHGAMLSPEHIDYMVEHGVFLVPTLLTSLRPQKGDLPAQVRAKHEFLEAKVKASFAAAVAAGVRIVVGTDAGLTPPHGTNLQELGLMMDHGASAMQALIAGTRDAADLLGSGDEVGTLEVGKRADVIVARGDAATDLEAVLRDLGDCANVLRVYKDAELVIHRA